MRVCCILVGAGRGVRLGKPQSKAFVKIKNTPLILHTFKKFLNIPQIKEYIVVVANRDIKLAKKILFPLSKKIKIVCGGDTRAESVRKGLSNISQNLQWVLIHDVARPFINRKDIIYILQKAQELKCCVFGKKITNALKSISQDNKKYKIVKTTISKCNVYEVYTPQVFKKEIILEAFRKYFDKKASDDSQIVERAGYKVFIIEQHHFNLKITYPEDLLVARKLI